MCELSVEFLRIDLNREVGRIDSQHPAIRDLGARISLGDDEVGLTD